MRIFIGFFILFIGCFLISLTIDQFGTAGNLLLNVFAGLIMCLGGYIVQSRKKGL